MATPTWSLRRLYSVDPAQIEALADVLIDCVEGGASVGFMLPLTRDRALAFWRRVADDVAAGRRALLVAEDAQGTCGTVQLIFDLPENQPHRADLAKMQVLDTVTGSEAERLYARLGWTRVGDIPRYALWPQGGFCSTTVFYRDSGGLVREEAQQAHPGRGRIADPIRRHQPHER